MMYGILPILTGDHFVGYQKQPNLKVDTTTVEDTLRLVIKNALVAAGRTDKGVHAISQVVDFVVSNKDKEAEELGEESQKGVDSDNNSDSDSDSDNNDNNDNGDIVLTTDIMPD